MSKSIFGRSDGKNKPDESALNGIEPVYERIESERLVSKCDTNSFETIVYLCFILTKTGAIYTCLDVLILNELPVPNSLYRN